MSRVETISGSQVAGLTLVIDALCVNQPAIGEVEIDTCSEKLLFKHRDVKVVAVVTCKVTACEGSGQRLGQLLECRLVLYALVRNAGKLLYEGRNGLARIDEDRFALFLTFFVRGPYLDVRYLDDSVIHQIKSRSLQVEDYQGLF